MRSDDTIVVAFVGAPLAGLCCCIFHCNLHNDFVYARLERSVRSLTLPGS